MTDKIVSEMMAQDASSIVIPAVLSPADAEGIRIGALEALEGSTQREHSMIVEVEGDSPTPCALQILVAVTRTAERLGQTLEISERGNAALAEL